jgi:hypothetical protein
MRCLVEARGRTTTGRAENQAAEEQFLEQFAAIEEGLALLQIQMRAIAENARLFGELAERIRASTYGAKVQTQ